ncbi:MAG: helix-turn-helix domain-containing protein, partial [Victivallales bacterium]|nr:helix-turn-helix domain-containing protein [Victivallales bacterium]
MILTLKELAEYLKLNERSIQRMLKTGQIEG